MLLHGPPASTACGQEPQESDLPGLLLHLEMPCRNSLPIESLDALQPTTAHSGASNSYGI